MEEEKKVSPLEEMLLLQRKIEQKTNLIKEKKKLIEVLEQTKFPPIDLVTDRLGKGWAGNLSWCSPSFYSHHGGYKMNLRVSGHLDQAEVYLCLKRGEFDDDLKWPFRGQVKVQVKHKNGPPLSLNFMGEVCRLSWTNYCAYDASSLGSTYLYRLQDGGYLQDDRLSFHISDIIVESK